MIATDPDLPAAVALSMAALPWTTTDVDPPEATAPVVRTTVAVTGTAALVVVLLVLAVLPPPPPLPVAGTTTRTVVAAMVARLREAEVLPWTIILLRVAAATKTRTDVIMARPTPMPTAVAARRTSALPMTDLPGTFPLAMAATDRVTVATLAMTIAEAVAVVDTGKSCFHS